MEQISVDLIIWLQNTGGMFGEMFFNFISFLGEQYVYILVLAIVYWTYDKKFGEYLATTLGISLSTNNFIKGVTELPRPYETYSEIENLRPETSYGSAFPSGHTQAFSSFLFAIAYKIRRYWWLIAIVLTLLMMMSRMYLGVHYLRDVLVGAALGITIAIGHGYLFNRFYADNEKLIQYYSIIALVLLPGLFFLESNSFFQGYGIMTGLMLATSLEKKYVGFSVDKPLKTLVLRVLVGFALLLATLMILKLVFGFIGTEEGSWAYNMLDFIRYFIVSLVGFLVYPALFKQLDY